MFCTQCGANNEDNAAFCAQCGRKLQPAPIPMQATDVAVPPGTAGIWAPNYLVYAILTTIFCCLPTGIVAIVFSAQVNGKLQAGDLAGAQKASKNAKTWCWLSFGFGILAGPITTILMLIAIPSYLNYVRLANETSAIKSIQTISQAQTQYSMQYPLKGYACTLTALGGDSHAGPPSASQAEILPPDLSSGIKSGYQFMISNCIKNSEKGSDRVTGFTITAQPITVGRTGNRTFCSDETGAIKFDPAGGIDCTQSLVQ
jgi:type IV pilus assembly protein PilA